VSTRDGFGPRPGRLVKRVPGTEPEHRSTVGEPAEDSGAEPER